MMDAMTRIASPYQLNPMNMNPLRDLLEDSIDFDMVRNCTAFKLYISATNVQSGKVKVFPREELTADMVMASACLPNVFQAVEIDGVPYWDGGYMGNPALFPFHGQTGSDDIVVIQINPIERTDTPEDAAGHPEPGERDQLQRQPAEGVARHRLRRPADPRGQAVGR